MFCIKSSRHLKTITHFQLFSHLFLKQVDDYIGECPLRHSLSIWILPFAVVVNLKAITKRNLNCEHECTPPNQY